VYDAPAMATILIIDDNDTIAAGHGGPIARRERRRRDDVHVRSTNLTPVAPDALDHSM
jgi:hypothetical protein